MKNRVSNGGDKFSEVLHWIMFIITLFKLWSENRKRLGPNYLISMYYINSLSQLSCNNTCIWRPQAVILVSELG